MKKQSLLTLPFMQLCGSGLLFFTSFNMIIPELPAYLDSLGGGEHKGLIIALFTVTAGLSRPFSGKLADTVGRVPVMIVGAAVSAVCGFLYPLTHTIAGFLAIRFLHGFSTGFKPTGTSAYVADIVPADRRGEAMGLLGFFSSIGIALGPMLGSYFASTWSLEATFYWSSAFAFLSIGILINMRETLDARQKFSPGLLRITRADIYERSVKPAAIVMALSVYSFGVVLTIVPDFSDALGVANKGYFFASFTVASLLVRVLFGRLSDKYGRVPVLLVSLLFLSATLFMLGSAKTGTSFLALAFCLGISGGGVSPTIFAWAIDLAEGRGFGRAMATLYIALEIGIGSGAFVSGLIFNNQTANIPYTFWASGFLALAAFAYLAYYRSTLTRRRLQAQDLV